MTQEVAQDPFLLKLVVISLGVVLIAGFGLVMLLLVRRIGALPTETAAAAPLPEGRALPRELSLALPLGARVAALGLSGVELAVTVADAAGERVMILDRRTGAVSQTVTLARGDSDVPAAAQ